MTQARAILRKVIADLPERELMIISARFGFDGNETEISELASKLNLTKERIRQIEKEVFQKLRNNKQIMNLRPVLC
jgi:DNA-directed RNA polymerase sigma subunit (sigma70/sigma32)